MDDQQNVLYGLLNGAIFNDLERQLTEFLMSCPGFIVGL